MEDVFVHYSGDRGRGLPEPGRENAEVEFDIVEHPKGPRADNVRVIYINSCA